MKEIIGKILSAMISSVFVSAILFVVTLSLMTRQFPPDFSKIKTAFEGLKQMEILSQQLIKEKPMKLVSKMGDQSFSDVSDVGDLESLNKERQKVAQKISLERASDARADARGVASMPGAEESEDISRLKEKVRELEFQLYRLQGRVNELDSRTKPLER